MSEPAAAIVLAGGKSSRMGTPKAMLPLAGAPVIVRVVTLLDGLFSQVIVAASPGQTLPPLPALVVRDVVAYQGPVGGIIHGLEAMAPDVAFVTSCDAAFLEPALIAHLLAQAAGYDVVVPVWDGRSQPLHAVYRKSVLPTLRRQRSAGDLKLRNLFDHVRTRRVDEVEVRAIDPEGSSFFNMNTPADYAEASRRMQGRGVS